MDGGNGFCLCEVTQLPEDNFTSKNPHRSTYLGMQICICSVRNASFKRQLYISVHGCIYICI